MIRLVSVELRYDAAIPYLVEQLVLADDAIPVLEQIQQHVENLGLERHAFTGAGQLAPFGIKLLIFKKKSHRSNPTRQPPHEKIKTA